MIEKLIVYGRTFLMLVVIASCTTSSPNNEETTELHIKLQVMDSINIESVVIKKMNCYTSTFAPVSPENFESSNTISIDSIIDRSKINSIVLSLNELLRLAEVNDKPEIDCRLLLELNYIDHREQYYFGFPGGKMFHNGTYYKCSVQDVRYEPCLIYSGIENVVK
jgi:hypothetical protein